MLLQTDELCVHVRLLETFLWSPHSAMQGGADGFLHFTQAAIVA